MRRAVLLAALLVPAVPARAATVTLAPVGHFDAPVYVTAPPGDTHRIFVVEKTGAIRIVKDGAVLATPFLSLAGHVSSDYEQGLLSMAFAPDFATSGLFYVDYTDTIGNSRVVEYHAPPTGDVAEPGSARLVLEQDQPQANHNGGQLQFGPDGDLYIGFGDGGNSDDVGAGHNPITGNGQDLSTWLGKILRIDPHPSGGQPYTVPPGNSFAATPGARAESWAYGLRNPWRFSFDRITGDLWIGDVGQNEFEEVDHAARGVGGQNYGWRLCEGTHAFSTADDADANAASCTAAGMTAPLLDYRHEAGRCSVTGGYVVRDPGLPSLAGAYVYGDYCTGEMWSVCPGAAPQSLGAKLAGLSSFGEDAQGRVYAASSQSGSVVRFSAASTTPCPAGGGGAGGGGGGATGGLGGRRMTFAVRGRVSSTGRVTLRARCPAGLPFRCRGTLGLRHGLHAASRSARISIAAGSTATVRLRLSRRERRSLARHRRLALRVSARIVGGGATYRFGARVTVRR